MYVEQVLPGFATGIRKSRYGTWQGGSTVIALFKPGSINFDGVSCPTVGDGHGHPFAEASCPAAPLAGYTQQLKGLPRNPRQGQYCLFLLAQERFG
jgi:hypothetical protein